MEEVMTKELTISKNKLEKLSPDELNDLAETKANFIMQRLSESTEKIQEAETAANIARDDSNYYFWNRTKKKVVATADALCLTNEAVAELNTLVRESVLFTCQSVKFANCMSEHIAAMLVDGFRDRDGNLVQVNEDIATQANIIMHQAQQFAENQGAVEAKQAEQSAAIKNTNDRLDEKDEIDKAQNQRLEELSALLSNKDNVDEKQEEEIRKNSESLKLLFDFMKQKEEIDNQQQKTIEEIQKSFRIKINSVIIISIVSLLSSIASILISLGLF